MYSFRPLFFYRYVTPVLLLLLVGFNAAGQVPVVFSVAPLIAKIGDTVTIDGANFNPVSSGNIVSFGATQGTVVSATASQLKIIVPVGATFASVCVLNTATGKTGCQVGNKFMPTFRSDYYRQDTINFRNRIAVGGMAFGGPIITAITDLDNDGLGDLVVNDKNAGLLRVYKNNCAAGWISSSSFIPAVSLTCNSATNVRAADVDGDGKPDLIGTQLGSARISVFRNLSSGTIAFDGGTQFDLGATGIAPYVTAVADFDHDGLLDICVSSRDSNYILVLKNNSIPGVIAFSVIASLRTSLTPLGITTADLDNDGWDEIISADTAGRNLSIFKNLSAAGSINFSSRISLDMPGNPIDVQCADIDGDGRLDIITNQLYDNKLTLFRNISSTGVLNSNSFDTAVNFITQTYPAGISVGDINGDGKPDITVGDAGSGGASSMFLNHATSGTFNNTTLSAKIDFFSGGAIYSTTLGDLDGDTHPDMIATNNFGGVFIMRGYPLPPIDTISGPRSICAFGAPMTYTNSVTTNGLWTVTNGRASIDSVTGLLTPHTPGKDTIIYYTIAGGDTNSRRLIVTLDSMPVVPVISGPTHFCLGASVTLTNTLTAGTWQVSPAGVVNIISSGGTATLTSISAGVTTISYSFANTCGTDSKSRTDTVITTPDAGIINGAAGVCGPASTTLSETVAGGAWGIADPSVATIDAVSGFITGINTGVTTVSYTLSNACGPSSATRSFAVNVVAAAGTITGLSAVCQNDTLALSDTAAGGVWSSSNTSRATVSSTGVVHGVSAGTVTIKYVVTNSCNADSVSRSITVNPAPFAGTISGASSVCAGSNVSLSTTGTPGGTWSSSATPTASVNSSGQVHGSNAGTAIISYSYTNGCGTSVDTQMITVNPLPVAGSISGSSTVCAGLQISLTETVGTGTWGSGNPSVATVNSGGIVTGLAAGSAVISYTVTNICGTVHASKSVTVNPQPDAGTITGIRITCEGQTITFSDTFGGGSGSWTSGTTSVATVAGGIVHAVGQGTSIISYTVNNICGTARDTQSITVNPLPVPGIITGANTVCAGLQLTLANTVDTGSWSSSAGGVATINNSGVVFAQSAGNTIISYSVTNSCGTRSDTQMIRVDPQPDAGIINGGHLVCQGQSLTLTNTVTAGSWNSSDGAIASITGDGVVHGLTGGDAVITYSYSNTCGTAIDTQLVTVSPLPTVSVTSGPGSVCVGVQITLTNATGGGTWSTSDASKATVTGGIVTGNAAGSAIISYTRTNGCGSISDTQLITVFSQPVSGTITGANTVCESAVITLSGASGGGIWTSSDTSVAKVIGGTIQGINAGTAMISYTVTNVCGTAADTQIITVNPLPEVAITAGPSSVCVGVQVTLTNDSTGGVWSTSNASRATVSGGVVTGVAAGTVVISYTETNSCGFISDTMLITVNSQPVSGVVTGANTMCTGAPVTLTGAIGAGTWSSSDTSIATVNAGTVTGVAAGTAIISYSVTNICGTAVDTQLMVVNLSPDAGTISGAGAVCEASQITLANGATGGSWGTSDMGIATVSGGIITGIHAGTAIISYVVTNTCGTDIDTQLVTVNPLPYAGTISGGSFVCTGGDLTLSASIGSGTWGAANGNATVAAGVVHAVNAGVDTITYVVTNGCGTDMVTHTVTIELTPDAGVITGPSHVCAGQADTLTDNAMGGSGTWSAGNTHATVTGGIVTGVSQGTVIISYSVTNTCGTVHATYPVAIDTLPDAGTITGPPSICAGAQATLSESLTGGVWSATNAFASVAGGVVTGISNGVDTIMYTTTNGCGNNVALYTILVNNSPYVDSISGVGFVCEGLQLSLANATNGGTWTSGSLSVATVDTSGVVTGVAGGTTTIYYAVTSICGTATATKTVTVNPLPHAGAITGPSHVCVGLSITLSDTVSGGIWALSNSNASITGNIVSAYSGGGDTAMYIVSNTCGVDTSHFAITIEQLADTGIISGPSLICMGRPISLSETASGGTWHSNDTTTAIVSASGVVTPVNSGTAIIIYTPGGGCNLLSAHYSIAIHPVPALSSPLFPPAVCDSTSFVYSPSSLVGGTSFAWARDPIPGIANGASTGIGGITETLHNTTPYPVSVPYTYILLAGGCADTQIVAVEIKPTPRIANSSPLALCGEILFDFIPLIYTPGTSYTWTRAAVTGVVPATASGTGIIHDSVVNTIGGNVTVVYSFALTANGCINNQDINVTLSEGAHQPHMTTHAQPVLCAGTQYQNFGVSDTPMAGEQFHWWVTSGAGLWSVSADGRNCLVNFNSAGLAWVYVANTQASSGCTLSDSFAVYVDGNLSDHPAIARAGDEFICLVNDESSYQWGYDDAATLDSTILTGEIGQDYYCPAPDLLHKYYWVITTRGSCMQKSYYNAPTAITNVTDIYAHLTIAPNPGGGLFEIELAGNYNGNVHYLLTDMLGHVVKEWTGATNNKKQVFVDAASGVYFLTAVSGNVKYTEKVMITR